MMGDSKPNFALDLSNEGVALWHRSSGGGWTTLGNVPLSAPDFSEQLAALRDGATKGPSRARRAVIRIPRSEVLLSKVRVGVFEGEAAIRHAHKQIADMSPYDMSEIAFDLGDKGFGNMAPVGIVSRQTLSEADGFAKANGFEPLYFTTQYAEKEFDREPRFYLSDVKSAAKPLWYVPWVAAASIGLAAGYFGYSYLTAPDASQPTATAALREAAKPAEPVETAVVETTTAPEPTVEPEPKPEPVNTATLGLQDVAPALPNVAATLTAPEVTQYPEMRVSSLNLASTDADPTVTRLRPTLANLPSVSLASNQIKTSDLQISEARRDLPDVSVNDDIVAILQSDMGIFSIASPPAGEPIVLAALTAPDQPIDPALLTRLPSGITTDTSIDPATQQPAARPVRPPSPITAAPGTLVPTPEGTPGPDYITIFAGRPTNEPRNRIDPLPPELELAGYPPRLRPADLNVPAELLAAAETQAEPTILDLADPALLAFRARLRPDTLVVPTPEPEALAAIEPTPEDVTPEATAPEAEPSLLALADPALRPLRARTRPDALSERAQIIVQQQEIASLGDPALRPFRPSLRPSSLEIIAAAPVTEPADTAAVDLASVVETAIADADTDAVAAAQTADTIVAAIAQDSVIQAIEDEAAVLALADPALRPFRARTRPNALRTISLEEQSSLLALADPSLAGLRTRARPSNLRIIRPEPEPEPEPEEEAAAVQEPETPVIQGTRFAIAASPKPKTRPRQLARIVQRVTREAARTNANVQSDRDSGGVTASGSTRATARLPKSAKGTVKSAPPSSDTVARAATEKSRFRKSRMNLVGIFGAPSSRRALIRLPSGRYVKVQNGDKVGGWKVSAIGESSLRIKKGSRDQVLRIP